MYGLIDGTASYVLGGMIGGSVSGSDVTITNSFAYGSVKSIVDSTKANALFGNLTGTPTLTNTYYIVNPEKLTFNNLF